MQSTLEQRVVLPALRSYITSLRTQAEDVTFLVNVLEATFKRLWREPEASQVDC